MSESARWSRGELLLWLGVFGLGVFLRAFRYDVPELWIDEYGTWWCLAEGGYGEVFDRATAVQGQSPLFYLLQRAVLDLFGASTGSLRLLPLLAGIALMIAVYRFAADAFGGRRFALGAMLVVAVHHRLIFASQDARPYSLAMLFAALSFHGYLAVLRGGGRRVQVAWIGTTVATWYAHYLFFVVVAVQALHFLATGGWRLVPWRRVLALALVSSVLALPGVWQFLDLLARRDDLDWLADPSLGHAFALVGDSLQIMPLLAAAAVFICLAKILDGEVVLSRLRGDGLLLVVCWFVVPIGISALGSWLLGVVLFHERYFASAIPAAAMLGGCVLAQRMVHPVATLLPALVFTVLVFVNTLMPSCATVGVFSHRPIEPWRKITSELVEGFRDGDVIVYRTGYVELDAVVAGSASPRVASFAEFPLAINLASGMAVDAPRTALPYGRRPDVALQQMRDIIERACESPRVWVVGGQASLDFVVNFVAALDRVSIQSDVFRSGLRLLLLVPEE